MWPMFALGIVFGTAVGYMLGVWIATGANYDLMVRHGRLIRFTVQAIAALGAYHTDQRAVELVEYGRQLLRSED